MARQPRHFGTAGALTIAVAALLPATTVTRAIAAPPSASSAAPVCAPRADRVKVTAFTLAPVAPKRCAAPVLTMTIENVSGCDLASVPWHITRSGAVLGAGTHARLGAGQRFTVTATWKDVKAGKHHLGGEADPASTLKEPAAQRADNAAAAIDVEITNDPLAEVKATADRLRAGAAALRDALPPAPPRTEAQSVLEAYSSVARFSETTASRVESEAVRLEAMCPADAAAAHRALLASVDDEHRKIARAYDALAPASKGAREAQSRAIRSLH